MHTQTTIIPIPLNKLLPHPENPNKMSEATFKKLKLNIKNTGNYEPLIVRQHNNINDTFEIINGHHRAKALKQLGYNFADCVEWDVDDNETRVLLATLNRLSGKDELYAKSQLIKNLAEKYNTKNLSKILPDTKTTIEKLKDITKPIKGFAENSKAFLNTLVFFLNDNQIEIVEQALEKALEKNNENTKAKRTAKAITKIAENYLITTGNRH